MGVPCEGKGWPWSGDVPGGGGLVPPSITSAQHRVGTNEAPFITVSRDGARLENGDLNPKFADVRSCHRHLLRRLCQQQPGARASFCSLTGFMNFNGQLLLGFSSSSRCFFPLTAFRVTLLLPKTSPGSWPALGIL